MSKSGMTYSDVSQLEIHFDYFRKFRVSKVVDWMCFLDEKKRKFNFQNIVGIVLFVIMLVSKEAKVYEGVI